MQIKNTIIIIYFYMLQIYFEMYVIEVARSMNLIAPHPRL